MKVPLRTLSVGFLFWTAGAPVNASPPPPAPNACAVHFCAEVFPVRTNKGFVTPEFEISSDDRNSSILARFPGMGSVLLRNELVDGSFCENRELGIEWVSKGSLEGYIQFPPSPERSGKTECRLFTVSSLTNPDLTSQLRVVWFTADYTVGTASGQIARNVELRIALPERK